MKLKTYSPRFAIAFTLLSAVGAPALLAVGASGQGVAAGSSVPDTTRHGPDSSGPTKADGGVSGVEILSDTRGVDFHPYLQEILSGIYGRWTGLLPEEARKPTLAKGETDIRVTISPDGRITAMHLDGNTHDDELNKAAWGAISGAQQFSPLPAAFTGPKLELRIHFRVNMEASGEGNHSSR